MDGGIGSVRADAPTGEADQRDLALEDRQSIAWLWSGYRARD